MTGWQQVDRPSEEQIRAARGVFARHRRRRHPDRSRCGFCGGVWRPAPTETGRLVEGCAARHLVAGLLDRAAQLDDAGRLLPPLLLDRPHDAAPPRLPVPPSVLRRDREAGRGGPPRLDRDVPGSA